MLEIRLCRSTIMKLFHVVQGCHGHSVAHIKYIPVTLSRTPPLLLMTQPLRLFRRPPWRLEWYKTHSGPVTQNCKDNSIFFFCGSALELSLTVWLQTIELQSYPWEYWCCQRGGWSVFIWLMEVTVQRLKTLYSEWTLPLGEVWHNHKKQKKQAVLLKPPPFKSQRGWCPAKKKRKRICWERISQFVHKEESWSTKCGRNPSACIYWLTGKTKWHQNQKGAKDISGLS